MDKIIIGRDIIKSFGEGDENTKVLDKVSVEINKGEFVAVMGPSGSGKSTLLFALSGMDTVDSGKILFCGREMSKHSENQIADIRRKQMGFVFQQPTMLRNLNILDNIILSSVRDNRKDLQNIIKKAQQCMGKVGIDGMGQRDITQVSGGQLQRAAICRAIMNEPDIIFADEPTGALNSKTAQEIMEIFSDINKEGTAIMLVTHDAKVAAYAERVLFMTDGKIESEINFSGDKEMDKDLRLSRIMSKMHSLGI